MNNYYYEYILLENKKPACVILQEGNNEAIAMLSYRIHDDGDIEYAFSTKDDYKTFNTIEEAVEYVGLDTSDKKTKLFMINSKISSLEESYHTQCNNKTSLTEIVHRTFKELQKEKIIRNIFNLTEKATKKSEKDNSNFADNINIGVTPAQLKQFLDKSAETQINSVDFNEFGEVILPGYKTICGDTPKFSFKLQKFNYKVGYLRDFEHGHFLNSFNQLLDYIKDVLHVELEDKELEKLTTLFNNNKFDIPFDKVNKATIFPLKISKSMSQPFVIATRSDNAPYLTYKSVDSNSEFVSIDEISKAENQYEVLSKEINSIVKNLAKDKNLVKDYSDSLPAKTVATDDNEKQQTNAIDNELWDLQIRTAAHRMDDSNDNKASFDVEFNNDLKLEIIDTKNGSFTTQKDNETGLSYQIVDSDSKNYQVIVWGLLANQNKKDEFAYEPLNTGKNKIYSYLPERTDLLSAKEIVQLMDKLRQENYEPKQNNTQSYFNANTDIILSDLDYQLDEYGNYSYVFNFENGRHVKVVRNPDNKDLYSTFQVDENDNIISDAIEDSDNSNNEITNFINKVESQIDIQKRIYKITPDFNLDFEFFTHKGTFNKGGVCELHFVDIQSNFNARIHRTKNISDLDKITNKGDKIIEFNQQTNDDKDKNIYEIIFFKKFKDSKTNEIKNDFEKIDKVFKYHVVYGANALEEFFKQTREGKIYTTKKMQYINSLSSTLWDNYDDIKNILKYMYYIDIDDKIEFSNLQSLFFTSEDENKQPIIIPNKKNTTGVFLYSVPNKIILNAHCEQFKVANDENTKYVIDIYVISLPQDRNNGFVEKIKKEDVYSFISSYKSSLKKEIFNINGYTRIEDVKTILNQFHDKTIKVDRKSFISSKLGKDIS